MSDLITPGTRSRIIRAIAGPRRRWRGLRRKVAIEIWKSDQAQLFKDQINYRFRFEYKNHTGSAPTVYQAIEQIERTIRMEKGKSE